jgi:hypothetical protein
MARRPEAAVAELESAYYMIACGHRPSFNPPDTNGGKTHDFDVVLNWGGRAAWEAKARLETTEYSSKSLNNVLKKARRQLPKDVHNIILVRIPESWSLEDGFESRMNESADYLFRNSGNRAISLIYHWELWTTNQGERNNFGLAGMEVVDLAWEILNPGRRVVARYRGFTTRLGGASSELRSGR